MVIPRNNRRKTTALALGLVFGLVPPGLIARGQATMPVNPDRPLAQTQPACPQALARLREARAGNPLLGAAENRAAVRQAQRAARRLCRGRAGPR